MYRDGWVDGERCTEMDGDGGMNRSREVDGWVIGARGGARDG